MFVFIGVHSWLELDFLFSRVRQRIYIERVSYEVLRENIGRRLLMIWLGKRTSRAR